MSLSGNTVWEVRGTGSDANGGGFVVGSGGTDYSQQDAAQLTVADAVTNGTTTVTSATGGFTSAMVGNGVNIAGTIRQITAVGSSTSITVDATVAAASGQTLKVGGALATLTKLDDAIVGSNTVWIKGSLTQTGTATFPNTNGEGYGAMFISGYGTTRGDDGRATITASGSGITLIVAGEGSVVANLILDGDNQTSSRGVSGGGWDITFTNCWLKNFTNGAFSLGYRQLIHGCEVSGCSSVTATGSWIVGCYAHDNSVTPWNGTFVNCISANNTGYGFISQGETNPIQGCTAYNNTSGGIKLQTNRGTPFVTNCILVSNGGYGIEFERLPGIGGGVYTYGYPLLAPANAFYNNTSGPTSIDGTTEGKIILTGNPFTNAAAGDFSLNSTAGAGAACKAAGFPAAFGSTTTNYRDIGAVQHQDSGGGGGKPRILSASLIGGLR